ncbi:hypothetical protein P154DRAFT_598462 [Amniculicola lignicola CBS 123094]|uniref:Aminoglycoside phosphotransferase domain-containing protein n=1 Tax=Amniculicola lignicola CBS 123094 TaxID=1392246 RepID=A0A6A5WHV5_9PLEO|nr:hypothetical protein P154DRAFT_598462 [Amniculicola lignicola CBS 123094]
MEWDERAELAHDTLCDKCWISSFRSGHPSEIIEDHCGSFNWSCCVRFRDGVEWLVQFAVPGRVMDGDKKLRREVAVMCLVREKTKILVPKSLGHLWREGPTEWILRSDISEQDLCTVYRQITGFYLKLSKLEFPNVGSLSIRDDQSIYLDLGPLTLKMQEIEAHGGVKVGGNCLKTFPSAIGYFDYVTRQDMEQLYEQPSSVDNVDDAWAKYQLRHQINAIIPRFVAEEYNYTSFRLIYDDFCYRNMIVNNTRELKIIVVIDWEWAYAALYHIFYSAPRWLLIKNLIFWAAPNGPEFYRYNACLEIFLNKLEQEESKRNRKSMSDGKFWFHELIYNCFTPANNSAWKAIYDIYPNADKLAPISEPELNKFVGKKMKQLVAYRAEWGVIKAKIDRKKAE